MAFYKYPSTNGFPDVVSTVIRQVSYRGKDDNGNPIYAREYELPKIKFHKTVKLHGTNAGVSLTKDGKFCVQSRNRELQLTSDNAGFYAFINQRLEVIKDYLQAQLDKHADADAIVLFGEFAGGNIQKGVALINIPKTFFPFGLAISKGSPDNVEFIEGADLLNVPDLNIRSIESFGYEDIVIDFGQANVHQEQLIKEVDEIDKQCPVGKALGVEGHGEGVVCVGYYNGTRLAFKVKGESHSTSKVRTLKDVDMVAYKEIEAFSKSLVLERRLEQGIEYLKEMGIPLDMTSTGQYIKWVNEDILKEEQLVLQKSGYEWKKIQAVTCKIAAAYYKNFVLNQV